MDEADLGTAERNLLHFLAFGLTERYPGSVHLIGRALSWSPTAYRSWNAGQPLATAEIPAAVVERLEAENRMDMELYRYARREFEKRVGVHPATLPT